MDNPSVNQFSLFSRHSEDTEDDDFDTASESEPRVAHPLLPLSSKWWAFQGETMKTKQVIVNDVAYVIKEPTVGVLFPIMDYMETDPKKFQMELAKASIELDGAPIGDRLLDLGLGEYLKLITEVISLSGLGEVPKP